MNTTKLRREFKQRLDSTSVPSNISFDEQCQRYDAWNSFLSNNIPTKLYRNRSFSTLSYEAFFYDQVWITIGSKMNDGYDARMYFDQRTIDNAIQIEFSNKRLEMLYKMTASKDNPLKQILDDYLSTRGYSEKTNLMEDRCQGILNLAMQQRTDILRGILDAAAQRRIKFACFSENIKSPDMWGHYTNSEEGFALQYLPAKDQRQDCGSMG